MVDILLMASPNGAATRAEWEARQANAVTPPSPSYDNRPSAEQLLVAITDPLAWKLDAACLGVEGLMYDREFDESKIRYEERLEKALRVCGGCAVRQACLDYALQNEDYHIWGGMTPRERKAYKRQKAS